ncbi:MAG: DUF1269 domain-containing protein [Bacillota bacterium]
MSTLSVWKFETAEGANETLNKLADMYKQQLIQIKDAAVVSWPTGKKRPRTDNYGSMVGRGMVSGAFWGMLFGLIFFVPLFGMAFGAAMGAFSGKFIDYGINDNFINKVRQEVTEGTSALFLLTSDAVRDRIAEEFKGVSVELIHSNLSKEEEEKLIEEFGS